MSAYPADSLTGTLFDVPAADAWYASQPPHVQGQPVRDRVRAHAVTEAAIESNCVYPEWFDEALNALWRTALLLPELTADDFWAELALADGSPAQNPSALGPVFRAAMRRGWIAKSGTYRVSERPETHRRPLRVWASLIQEGKNAA